MQFVKIYEKKIDVKDDIILDLSKMNIQDILDIKGLESLVKLRDLDLFNNQISEIKGLESFTKLERLSLRNNQIIEIKGFESLTKLFWLSLWDNFNSKYFRFSPR